MKNGMQVKLANKIGKSESFISLILNGERRPSWSTAKILAKITNTKPELWLEGKPETIRTVLESVNWE